MSFQTYETLDRYIDCVQSGRRPEVTQDDIIDGSASESLDDALSYMCSDPEFNLRVRTIFSFESLARPHYVFGRRDEILSFFRQELERLWSKSLSSFNEKLIGDYTSFQTAFLIYEALTDEYEGLPWFRGRLGGPVAINSTDS